MFGIVLPRPAGVRLRGRLSSNVRPQKHMPTQIVTLPFLSIERPTGLEAQTDVAGEGRVRVFLAGWTSQSVGSWPDVAASLEQALDEIAKAKETIFDSLAEVKNQDWLEAGQLPLSRAEFIGHLALSSVSATTPEDVELLFTCGDLFWGHYIVLRWSPELGFHAPSVEG